MNQRERTVLIADDEPDILEILDYSLAAQGYNLYKAKDGEEALQMAVKVKPDLIVLDIMLPYKNGMEVCKILRSIPDFKETLIIFLTALTDEKSHVKGLEYGADDYIIKPVSPRVLVSKVNSLFRRLPQTDNYRAIQVGNIFIDPLQFLVRVNDREIVLAKKEFELLYLLASEPGRVFPRNEILDHIWGTDVIVGDRTIDVHIRKIRQKLEMNSILTVKGVGYKFVME
ncbi:MAG: response regulator transcription factor [Chitinophagaceae bacterium]|nr:response regulator transcription factor [Chitinophagaceae bacterium]